MNIKWICPMCRSEYEDDLAEELFHSCCVDTKLVPIDDIIEEDKKERRKIFNIENCEELYHRLENYILGRYDNFEEIGYFHIEYSSKEGILHFEIMGEKITEECFFHKINKILEGIYNLWQKENEPYEGKLYELMLDFEILKEKIDEEEMCF